MGIVLTEEACMPLRAFQGTRWQEPEQKVQDTFAYAGSLEHDDGEFPIASDRKRLPNAA